MHKQIKRRDEENQDLREKVTQLESDLKIAEEEQEAELRKIGEY